MKNKIAIRNPRSRRRNLSRGQKVGIGLLAASAVGGVTALVVAMRRRKKRTEPSCPPGLGGQPMRWNAETEQCEPLGGGGGQGSGAPGIDVQLSRARRRLCLNPNALTLEQRLLLRDQIVMPLIAAAPNPMDQSTVAIVEQQMRDDVCPGVTPPSAASAIHQLVQQSWEIYAGFQG